MALRYAVTIPSFWRSQDLDLIFMRLLSAAVARHLINMQDPSCSLFLYTSRIKHQSKWGQKSAIRKAVEGIEYLGLHSRLWALGPFCGILNNVFIVIWLLIRKTLRLIVLFFPEAVVDRRNTSRSVSPRRWLFFGGHLINHCLFCVSCSLKREMSLMCRLIVLLGVRFCTRVVLLPGQLWRKQISLYVPIFWIALESKQKMT